MAECDALGLAMEGDSLDELHSLIAESCHLLFEDLLKDGELEKFPGSAGLVSCRRLQYRTGRR